MKLIRLIKWLDETCSKLFPTQNGLKQGDALLPLLLNFECMRSGIFKQTRRNTKAFL